MKHKVTSWAGTQVEILAAVLFVIILLVMISFGAGIFLAYAAMVLGYPTTDFIGTAVGASRFLLAVMLVSYVAYLICAYLKSFKD